MYPYVLAPFSEEVTDIAKAKDFCSPFASIRGAILTESTCKEPSPKEKVTDDNI
jgi:hypothetical protein